MDLSKEPGFFKDFYVSVKDKCTDEQLKNFANLETDEQRFKFIAGLDAVKELKLVSEFVRKDADAAAEWKKQGNQHFQKMQWAEALQAYGKSLILLPSENESDQAVIYANRSAALYHLERYDMCLRDIERSIALGYPKDILYKALERKARCLLAKKLYAETIEAFQKTISSLDSSKLSFEKREKMTKDCQIMIMMLTKDIERTKKGKVPIEAKDMKRSISGIADFVSKSIEFDHNSMEGRFAKANQEINVGEAIMVEKPHVAMLLEKFSKSHCQHCFKRTMVPLACPKCCDVIFCSDDCKQKALETYHKFECGILQILWRSGSSINCHMALRTISQKPIDYFVKLRTQLEEGFTYESTEKLPYDDYRKVYNLVRHEAERTAKDFFQYSLMSYFLASCLQLGGYTPAEQSDFVGALVLRNLQFLQFNTHELFELQQSSDRKNSKTVFIGGGLYPTLALFNHSCEPSVVRYFKGTSVYVHAIKNIQPGMQVSENYGPLYTQSPREERQDQLKDLYWFECTCDPCLSNWPVYDEFKGGILRFRCDSGGDCDNVLEIPIDCNEFMIKCIACGEHTNLLKGLKSVQDTDMIQRNADRYFDNGDIEKAMLRYIDMLKIMHDVMAPPFKDYCNCQQKIRDCLLHFGNRYTIPS